MRCLVYRVRRGRAGARSLIDSVIVDNGEVEIRNVIPMTPHIETTRFYQLRKDYFQMPCVAGPGPPTPELPRIELAELAAPFADGLVGHYYPTGQQQLFDIAVAQAKAEIQPDAVA